MTNSASIVVAHCHPSGDTDPSPEDLALTWQLLAASDVLGIPLRDHLVVAEANWRSLRETTDLWERAALAAEVGRVPWRYR